MPRALAYVALTLALPAALVAGVVAVAAGGR